MGDRDEDEVRKHGMTRVFVLGIKCFFLNVKGLIGMSQYR